MTDTTTTARELQAGDVIVDPVDGHLSVVVRTVRKPYFGIAITLQDASGYVGQIKARDEQTFVVTDSF